MNRVLTISSQSKPIKTLVKTFSFIVQALPLVILAAIFGLFDVPEQPLREVALWFLYAPLADFHLFNFALGLVFVTGLGALYRIDWRRKRALFALVVGVAATLAVSISAAVLDQPGLTPAALSMSVAACAVFWALSSARHRSD